ncbi:MoaF-related domain-containing protein [Pandoraea pulmonicola]|uniref:MoaF-like domain-containing protein n=1 Tax=Pandoraea pulmonicola TaxID=93221 RepID=A0AAJ4ZH72_PANPU|nr:hypothetical protein [Pandoraea pulmonicola]AJC22563.1 hypothetical protein RO07_22595 [Pandoraea pulmonicola]SUA93249.1 Uncharacterised protein [Pandoraea pulmonicola]
MVKSSTDKYPAPGHVYEFNFGDFAFYFDFDKNGKEMTFTEVPSEKPLGVPKETVRYTAVPIRPGVFMVYWQEHNKATIVHVEDFENGIFYTNMTLPDHGFVHRKGTFKKIR